MRKKKQIADQKKNKRSDKFGDRYALLARHPKTENNLLKMC